MINANENTPSIYVACVAAYNNGYLHGAWIDATQSEDEIHEEIQQLLAKSPIGQAEEWAIHDYENFGTMRIHEYCGIDEVAKLAEFVSEHGELGAEVASYCCGDIDQALTMLEDDYHGEYSSEKDFAESLFDDCYIHEIPEYLRFYIDYESFARDIFISDYFSIEANGKTHVFSC